MSLSANSIHLLKTRYCHAGENPKDVFKRVANALSLGDVKFERKLEKAMMEGNFLPNSPCLRNAGIKKGILHACYCLPIQDDMESISNTLKNMIMIFKGGGGVGINFSKLRPKDSDLSGGGTSSGVVSFMTLFDTATEVIKQGGFRRGALMGILNFEHAEIMEFIRSKLTGKLTNFNISVLVSDAFMNKVESGENIDLKNPKNDNVWSTVNAKTIFDVIAFSAWNSGDPGFLFYDRINKDNIYFPKIKIKTTNPCFSGDTLIHTTKGNIPIQNLVGKETEIYSFTGEIDNKVVKTKMINIRKTGEKKEVWELTLNNGKKIKCTPDHEFFLRSNYGTVSQAKFLCNTDSLLGGNLLIDNINVIDKKFYKYCDVYDGEVPVYHNFLLEAGVFVHNCGESPLPDYGACCLGSINISNFVKYNKFDFDEFEKYVELSTRALRNMNAVSFFPLPEITKVMKELDPIGVGIMGFADCLIKLGIRYDSEDTLKFIDEIGKIYKNVTDSLAKKCFWKRIIAPTGSLSILANCSSGIEPIFDTNFDRHLTVGILNETREIYKSKLAITAHQVSPDWHLKIQAKWQSWIDGSISKTINLPNSASVDDIKDTYLKAWKSGCKGITIFRDGCKEGVLRRSKCDDGLCHL